MNESGVKPNRFTVAVLKATGYLLDETHPNGGSKAQFLMRFGFTPNDPVTLLNALLDHPSTGRCLREALTPLGQTKLVYEGLLRSPDGHSPKVRTVWRIRPDGTADFVTLVPIKR